MISYNRYIYISFPSKRLDCFGSLLRFAVMHLDFYIHNRDRHDHPIYVIMHVNAKGKEHLCVTHHLMQPVVYLNNMSLHNILQWNTDDKAKYF